MVSRRKAIVCTTVSVIGRDASVSLSGWDAEVNHGRLIGPGMTIALREAKKTWNCTKNCISFSCDYDISFPRREPDKVNYFIDLSMTLQLRDLERISESVLILNIVDYNQ